ncbi:MAG: hypothetical protein CM15mP39_05370 [Synechococcus sp.]|nr:MAG: hypothetical protein CM15mP39_05370 [Synechococcus sp.]
MTKGMPSLLISEPFSLVCGFELFSPIEEGRPGLLVLGCLAIIELFEVIFNNS